MEGHGLGPEANLNPSGHFPDLKFSFKLFRVSNLRNNFFNFWLFRGSPRPPETPSLLLLWSEVGLLADGVIVYTSGGWFSFYYDRTTPPFLISIPFTLFPSLYAPLFTPIIPPPYSQTPQIMPGAVASRTTSPSPFSLVANSLPTVAATTTTTRLLLLSFWKTVSLVAAT